MATTKFCEGVSDFSDTYMGFIIDQWGVLHDGRQLYEGVVDCLEQLKIKHKKVLILSNSGAPAEDNKQQLDKMGLPRELYVDVVTSGELIRRGLTQDQSDIFSGFGKHCYIFGKKEAHGLFEGTDILVVDDIEDADFMLIAGADPDRTYVEDYAPILKAAVRKRVKAICTNPDSRSLLGAHYLMGPGLIAKQYEEYGGVVQYIGKPHAPIFKYCIEMLQPHDVYPANTVMIGDTMAHDIMGAANVNIDTCLVKTGMHAGVFKNCTTPAEVDRTLDVLITHYNHVRPRYLLDALKWGKALPDRKHKVHKKHVRRKKVPE